jgi:hypothetical protein
MKMAFGPKRLKSLRNKYLPLVLIVAASLFGVACKAQTVPSGFPTLDSLSRYNNRYVGNTPVEAFSNLRMRTLIRGIIDWLGVVRAEASGDTTIGGGPAIGMDTLYLLNDSTLRYRKDGDTYNISLTGLYGVRNGITKWGGVIEWGGALVQNTEINQSGNELTFHGGQFTHGTGDYLSFLSPYSRIRNNTAIFQSVIGDGGTSENELINNFSAHQIQAQVVHNGETGTVRVQGNEIYINQTEGNVKITSLIDSVQAKAIYYDPATGKLTYGDAASGGGGGGSNRFGVAGEDDIATNDREFDQDGNGITLKDGMFEHGFGDFIDKANNYSTFKHDLEGVWSETGSGEEAEPVYTLFRQSSLSPQITFEFSHGATVPEQLESLSHFSMVKTGLNLYNASGRVFMPYLIDSAQSYSLQYNPTNGKVTYALSGGGSGGGGGGGSGLSQNAANGLAMRNDSTVILGGSLDAQTTIDGGASYTTNFTGSRGSGNSTLTATNTGAGIAFTGNGTQYGVRGLTTTGAAVRGEATAGGIGVSAISTVLPFQAQLSSALTSTYGQVGEMSLLTSGTPANNLGIYLGQYVENSSGLPYQTARFGSKWTDVTHATRTSQIELFNTNLTLDRRVLAITGPGQLILDKYGVGDFEDTPVYGIGVDASGNVVEYDLAGGGGGGLSAVAHDGTLTGTGTALDPLEVNTSVIATTDYVDSKELAGGTTLTGWTNVLSIPGVVSDAAAGATVGSSPTGTNVAGLINAWIATATAGSTLFFPRTGTGFRITSPIIIPSTKLIHVVVEGAIYAGTSDAFIIDGYMRTFDSRKGNIYGTNQTAGAPNYGSQTNTGVWVRSCESCNIRIGEVMGFKYANQVGGYATGTALVQGAQFNQIYFQYFRRNSVGVYVHPSGGTSNSNGNWANMNGWWGGKIVADTGVLFRKDITQGDRFNGNNFYQIGFENGGTTSIAMDVAIYMDYAVNNSFFGCRFEPNPITRKLVCDTDVDNTNFFGTAYFQWDWLDAPGNNIHISGAIYDGASGISVGTEAHGYGYSSGSFFNQRVRVKGGTRSPSGIAGKPSNIDVEYSNNTSVSSTASTYTVAEGINFVRMNYASGVAAVTLPSSATHPDQTITVKNLNGSNALSVVGQSNIAAGGVGVYRSAGGSWIKIN